MTEPATTDDPQVAYEIAQQRIEEAERTGATELELHDLPLTELPPEIGRLSRLEKLFLGSEEPWREQGKARLATLPSEIGQLIQLQRLYLSQNNLTQLPPEIVQLTQLRQLYLSQNNLTQLPPEIGQLSQLQGLGLQDNPKLLIPPEICQEVNNPQAILSFWQKQGAADRRSLNEAKLILVGEGGVGKTSLVQQLCHNRYNPHENKTEGIAITPWTLPVKRGDKTADIQLNIWDFGGQEIMHATHQFFLTRRSLYLLVLDVRQGEAPSRVEYWLALIRSFAADAPILIVLNKSDQHHLDLNRRGLLQKYPSIVGFVATSARTGAGIADLKVAIQQQLAQLDHVDTPFPASWYAVKSELETLQKERDYLLYHEYQQLCQRHEVDHDTSQRTLIRFLHDLGVLLNFQDDDRVRDTNILNPEWVTRGVYTLINAPALAQQGGVLPRQQLGQLLNPAAYPPERHHFILQMMEKFELAYPFEGGSRYLVPDLLPVEEPPFPWDDGDALAFEYHYAILPHSILHRFMVRQHPRICQQNGRPLAWRTGVVLAYDQLQALIKADIEDRKMEIWVRGNGRKREFLSMLRFTFDSIHESITGTKPTEQVPIPGHPGVVVPYQHLLVLEQNNIREQILPGLTAPINVRQLLDGIEDPASRHPAGLTRQELLRLLQQAYNADELKELCFALGVVHDDLEGNRHSDRLQSLIGFMERRGRLPDLYDILADDRPHLFDHALRHRPQVYR